MAGAVALGCCVGPAVAALLGVMSAAVALDLALTLFREWGWAFKAAGVLTGVAAVVLARRRARRCPATKRSLAPFVATLVVSGLVTYGILYGVTTWLGGLATGG